MYLSEPQENVLKQFRDLYQQKFGYTEVLDMNGMHPANVGPNTIFIIDQMMTPGSSVYRGEKVKQIFSQMSPQKVQLIKKLILTMYERGLKFTRDMGAGRIRNSDGFVALNDEDMERNKEFEKAHMLRIENFKKEHALERKKKVSVKKAKRKICKCKK